MAASLIHFRNRIGKTLLFSALQEKCVFYSSVAAKDLSISKVFNPTTDNEEVVEYPTIRPKYPPGEWGEMEPSYAWLWQKTIDDLMLTPDIKERQDKIISNEIPYLNALPSSDYPNYFEFAKYATKTALIPWSEMNLDLSPTMMDEESEKLVEEIKRVIVDNILIQQETVDRDYRGPTETLPLRTTAKKQKALFLRCLVNTLIINQNRVANHLKTCQYDENVIVRAVWDRHGFERIRRHLINPTYFKNDKVYDQSLSMSCIFNGMIRSHIPLPEFQPRLSGPSVECEKPTLKNKYPCYGVNKSAAHKAKSILAGHILGDPCEYGLLGFLLTEDNKRLNEKFGPKLAKECRLGRCITSTFSWLAAQAYNQGFSGFIDLTYPLTSLTVQTDGRNFSFLAYQLNTLELWKPDSANNIANLCWHSDEMLLYDCVENGEVKGFNEDVLRILMKMFQLAPADRGYDMKPTIERKEIDLHKKSDFIPRKVEEVKEEEEEEYIV